MTPCFRHCEATLFLSLRGAKRRSNLSLSFLVSLRAKLSNLAIALYQIATPAFGGLAMTEEENRHGPPCGSLAND
jgi:hypothetical protein